MNTPTKKITEMIALLMDGMGHSHPKDWELPVDASASANASKAAVQERERTAMKNAL